MLCELCGSDPNMFVLIPRKTQNGCLETIACLLCAKKSGLFCDLHERPHIGFDGGTHACVLCIEEDLMKHVLSADVITTEIERTFAPSDRAVISGYLDRFSFGFPERLLVRCVVTLARRIEMPFDDALKLMLDSKSALPFVAGVVPVRFAGEDRVVCIV